MNGQKQTPHAVSGLFVFLLLGLFAVFGTVLTLLGAKAYNEAAARTGMHNSARISSAYIRTMLRADDTEGVFSIASVLGTVTREDGSEEDVTLEVLALRDEYDGEAYVTYLYVWDGSLREWFTDAATPFRPAEGEIVCAADAFKAELDGNLLQVELQEGGQSETLLLALRAGGAA